MRVGIVGAGWVSGYHLPAWRAIRGVEIVALCDPDETAARGRAAAFSIERIFGSLEAMLDGVDLDAVDIASPRQFHAAQVRACIERGLPVLCQKPLGVDLAEAVALVEAVEGRAPLMVHENWRFRPYYRLIRTWLTQGAIGKIVSARLDFHSSGMLPDAEGRRPALVRQPFLASLERLLVAEILIHHLDTLRCLLGEMVLLDAFLSRSNGDILGEDVAILRLTGGGGGMPVVLSGNLSVHGAPPAPSDHLVIHGSEGTIVLEGTVATLYSKREETVSFDPAHSYQGAYDGAIGHFVESLVAATPFETSPRDNLKTLELVEAAYRASQFKPKAKPAIQGGNA